MLAQTRQNRTSLPAFTKACASLHSMTLVRWPENVANRASDEKASRAADFLANARADVQVGQSVARQGLAMSARLASSREAKLTQVKAGDTSCRRHRFLQRFTNFCHSLIESSRQRGLQASQRHRRSISDRYPPLRHGTSHPRVTRPYRRQRHPQREYLWLRLEPLASVLEHFAMFIRALISMITPPGILLMLLHPRRPRESQERLEPKDAVPCLRFNLSLKGLSCKVTLLDEVFTLLSLVSGKNAPIHAHF